MPRVVLIHGAATTSAVWAPVLTLLSDHHVLAVDRPATGNLDLELEWLAPFTHDSLVVGASGGATLGLALAASTISIAGAIAHEPAVGSLVPELLAPVVAAYSANGAAGLGSTLYGPLWRIDMIAEESAVGRDLAMFRAFEPRVASPGQGRVVVTTGALSPAVRHEAARLLHVRLGYETTVIDGCSHFIARENPAALAALISAAAVAIEAGAWT